MTSFPAPERREITKDATTRTYVRYPGQSHWYRSLATAQIAFQRRDERNDPDEPVTATFEILDAEEKEES